MTKRISGLLAGVLLALPAFAGEIRVQARLLPDGQWQAREKQLITRAARIVFQRIATAKVANCAYRNSFREKKDVIRKIWSRQIPHLNKSRQVSIIIHRKKLGPGVLGRAKVGIAAIEPRFHRLENLEIDLSREQIHNHLQKRGVGDTELWVNTIAHEVAHNFGHRHGAGGRWAGDYPGYFPTELGFCVMTDGRYGSDGGDLQKRRQWQRQSR